MLELPDPSRKRSRWRRLSRKSRNAIRVALVLCVAWFSCFVALPTLAFYRFFGRPSADFRFVADGLPFRVLTIPKPPAVFWVEIRDGVTDQTLARSYDANWMGCTLIEDRGQVWFNSGDIGLYVFARVEGNWQYLAWGPPDEVCKQYPMPRKVFETLSKRRQEACAPFLRAGE